MWWAAAYILQVVLIVALAIREVAQPTKALTWIVISLILPGVGFIAYLLLNRKVSKRTLERIRSANQLEPASVTLLGGGIATFDVLLTAIVKAKRSIDVEYYIFRNDHIGGRVVERLCQAARRGVKVRFMRDGLGSRSLSRKLLQAMAEAGIECRVFAPVSGLRMLNHRDHCKIVVIDGNKALIGGINVGDEYTGVKKNIGPWRDADLLIEGEAVQQVANVFEANFTVAELDVKAHGRHSKPPRRPLRPNMHRSRTAMVETSTEFYTDVDAVNPHLDACKAMVQTVESGPDSRTGRTRMAFFRLVTSAKHSICLTTPYFAPEVDLSMALCAAAERGVRTRLILPKQPDHRLIALASWTYFEPLMKAGVEIFLYEGAVLHAKLLTVDGNMSMVGAANWDIRSFRENYEISSLIQDRAFAKQVEEQFERDINHCRQLSLDDLYTRSLWLRSCQQGARLFAALL